MASRYQVHDYGDIPVPAKDRIRTDIFCTICSSIFAIILFIIACASFNRDNLSKMTYPNDTQGNLCGWGKSQNYKILYFASLTDPTKRLCVSSCPHAGDQKLNCFATPSLSCDKNTNPKYQVNIFETTLVSNGVGAFCLPVQKTAQDQVSKMAGIQDRKSVISTYNAMWHSLWLGFLFGAIYLAVAQFFPKKVFNWVYVIGGGVFILAGILTMILPRGSMFWKLIAGIFLIVIGIMILYNVANSQRRREIVVGGRIFECATEIWKNNWFLAGYIGVFIAALALLFILVAFQVLAIWSAGSLTFDPQKPYYQIKGFMTNVLSFFIFFQLIWGMSFLKQAFNFCISGYATQWYYYKNQEPDRIGFFHSPLLLVKYHWGSVVGGALMLQIFYIIDLVGDYFSPTDVEKRPKGYTGQLQPSRTFNGDTVKDPRKCSWCCELLNLVRSEAMAYINLVSIPYCNASRYCEMLAEDSNFYDRSQTTNRLYRISAHAILISLTSVVAFAVGKTSSVNTPIIGVIFVFLIALFIVTYFISFHSDLAEGILVSVFVQQKIKCTKQLERPPECVRFIYEDDITNKLEDTGFVAFLI